MIAHPPAEIRRAYLAACLAELRALKPGNVHLHGDGHGMSVADFEASAMASADAMARPGLPVGQRILRAVRRTRKVAGCNTNLGIVLLCAPLAQAAATGRAATLHQAIHDVLTGLDVADAAAAFEAIRLADPGGLGASRRHDVSRPPRASLRIAMQAAQRRDRIARQYAAGFVDVFGFGQRRLRRALRQWQDADWAVTAVYLGFLGRFVDSHIRRKFGPGIAGAVRRRAEALDRQLMDLSRPTALRVELLRFDTELKRTGINPGTSADLTVATMFAAELEWREATR